MVLTVISGVIILAGLAFCLYDKKAIAKCFLIKSLSKTKSQPLKKTPWHYIPNHLDKAYSQMNRRERREYKRWLHKNNLWDGEVFLENHKKVH